MRKLKALVVTILAVSMLISVTACSSGENESSSNSGGDASSSTGKVTIGVSMPTKDLQRWQQDGASLKTDLEEKGYDVDLQYAGNDVAQQVSQIENMISNGVKGLIVCAIDGESLGTPLAAAKEAGIPVVSYERLIMNTDAVSYYVTFDNYLIGKSQADYIVKTLDLDNSSSTFNIELVAGDPGDNNAKYYFDGSMDVLQPYIDSGKLVVKSNQTDFATCATADWSSEKAQNRVDTLISGNYSDGTQLDAVLCNNDSTALGATNALEAAYTGSWPIITGQDCDIANVKNIIAGKQGMDIFKDTRNLAERAVIMIDSAINGKEAETNDTKSYDNGTGIIPTYLCELQICTKDNYKELLIDSGYYAEDDLK